MMHFALDYRAIMQALWQWTWQASVVISLVLLLRWFIFRGPLVRWRSLLWLIVLARLLLPVHPPSNLSVFNAGEWMSRLQWRSRAATIPSAPFVPSPLSAQQMIVHYGPIPMSAAPTLIVAAPAPAKQSRLAFGLGIAWIVGALLMLFRTARAQLSFTRRLRAIPPTNDPKLQTALNDAAAWMHIAHPPRLLLTDAATSPAISGLIKPTLLLPPGSVDTLTPSQLRHVFLHELAHLKRGDLWIDLLCTIVLAAQWFNPFAWLACTLYRSDREVARDAMAIKAAPQELADSYGHTIVALIERIGGHASLPAGVLGILEPRNGVRQRVIAIAERRFGPLGWPRATLVLLLMLLVGAAALTSCKDASPKNTADAAANPTTTVNEEALNDAADNAARVALQQRIPELKMRAKDLTDAVHQLSAVTGETIAIESTALDAIRPEPIEFNAKDITLQQALWTTLSDAGRGHARLDFNIIHGTITVSTDSAIKLATARTEVYDIGDLLVDVPDFTDAPLLSVGAGVPTTRRAQPDTTEKSMTQQEKMQAVIKLVKETVDPNSWGQYATIRSRSKQLVVYQTAENQAALTSLLEKLRESRAIEITVESRFLQIDSEQMKGYFNTDSSKPGSGITGTFLRNEQVDALLNATKASASGSVLSAPRLTLFNGQRAYVALVDQQDYVSDIKAVRGKDRAVSYQPVMSQLSVGAVLDVQATVSSDRHYVTMTLHPQLSSLRGFATERWKGSPPGENNLFVQIPLMDATTVNTTCSIPNGGTLLLGGLSSSAQTLETTQRAKSPARPTTASNSKLGTYILVRPTIILTRESTKQNKPAPSRKYQPATDSYQ